MAGLMRAVAQLGQAYNVSVIDVPIPTILNATDVIVKINATAICGSDLHTYHVASGSLDTPLLYGHEAIGYITEIGDAVQFLNVGDYVVIPDNLDNGHYTVEPDHYTVPIGFGGIQDGTSEAPLPGLQSKSKIAITSLRIAADQIASRVRKNSLRRQLPDPRPCKRLHQPDDSFQLSVHHRHFLHGLDRTHMVWLPTWRFRSSLWCWPCRSTRCVLCRPPRCLSCLHRR